MASAKSKLLRTLNNSYVKTVILALIIIGGVAGFWLGLRLGLRTDYPLLTVASPSMVPTLNVGDLIVVQGVPNASDLITAEKPDGDIIVFRSPRISGELIVHRTVYKELHNGLWFFETEGDGNYGADRWSPIAVPAEDIWNGMISEHLLIGKVVGKVPWLGFIPLYIRTPQGIIVIVILILLIVFAEYLPVLFRKTPEKESVPTDSSLSQLEERRY